MFSAPNSGLKVFFSLKFLKSLMLELDSLTAYSELSWAQTNSWAEPNDLFLEVHLDDCDQS